MTKFNDMVQLSIVASSKQINELIKSNDGYGNAIMAQWLFAAPSEQMIEFNNMVQ